MAITLVICITVMTLYTISTLAERGRTVTIGDKEVTRTRKPITYIIIALLNVAYIAACTYLAVQLG